MKQKIVITGGLGYLGCELCKLYSGEARYKEITVVDNRFISERVKQLTDWGIHFMHGNILDKDFMSDLLKGADIVYHLAGITDVAYTKTELNSERDKAIMDNGIVGTQNVINNVPATCKIIFPSTHVVFEGFSETKFDIEENEIPNPVLTYSDCKVISEKDIRNSGLNYIIARLGSVYGYSTDTARINIMPNLFSKIASQNGTISLFSGGVQHKSLIAVTDVVRGFKFLAESEYNKEIFHLCNENLTIKEVAEICKKVNPKVELIETNDEIPNLGYTLSNKKLLSTGFKFLYNIETCIKEMITNWSEKQPVDELEYIIKGGKEYVDARGKISNYELTEPINLIGYIESKACTVRANHYHPIQEQKCLLIRGSYISVTKDLAYPNSVIETRIIKEKDIAVIRPNVAHTMVFLEDSIFLNLVRGEREHENYGITHTIPYILVDEKFRVDLIENYKRYCRCCGGHELNDVISLGLSPLANSLVDIGSTDSADMYPLELKYCSDCHNVQLSYVVPPAKMFDNYLYVSSTAASFRKHFEDAAEQYIKEFYLDSNSLVIDIGSNDGVFLKPLKERGVQILGIEPAKNICDIANANGIETINSYCDYGLLIDRPQIKEKLGKAKIVTASNVFAHADYLDGIINTAFQLLEKDGVFIVEVQYLLDTIKDLTFDNIYHEHVNYWSVTALNNFCNRLGYALYKVEHINTHGGSIRAYIKRGDGSAYNKQGKGNQCENSYPSVITFLNNEMEFGITNYQTYKDFAKNIVAIKENVAQNIKTLQSQYKRIAAYGSPAKATTALNYFGIDRSVIEYTVDDNELKQGKCIPVVNIPIKGKEHLEHLPDLIIVLAWNFFDDIVKNNYDLVELGVKFISIKDLQKKP